MADTLLFLMKTLLLDETTQNLVESLKYYQEMLLKHIDLVMRRVLNEEVIPHSEKVFSIFEPHVEWLAKGKTNCPIEIGHITKPLYM
jgi:IS5 family transposase